jgi:hypothetical protein
MDTNLSTKALALLHACATGDNPHVDASNIEAYRELVAAGVMYPVSGMFRGPEANFRFTAEGWRDRHEILASRVGSP